MIEPDYGSRGGRMSDWKSIGSLSPICSAICSRSSSTSTWAWVPARDQLIDEAGQRNHD